MEETDCWYVDATKKNLFFFWGGGGGGGGVLDSKICCNLINRGNELMFCILTEFSYV